MRWPNCVRSSRPLALSCTRLFPAQNLLQKRSERQPANYKASLTSGVARACNFAIFIVEQFAGRVGGSCPSRSEEHTSELQSLRHLVCRLLLENSTLTPHIYALSLHDALPIFAAARAELYEAVPSTEPSAKKIREATSEL